MSDTSYALLKGFLEVFTGNTEGYGEHIYGEIIDGQKESKGKSYTKNAPVTDSLYKSHLGGIKGLGISPINSSSNCSFGVIDVDSYIGSYDYIIDMIYQNDLPLTPFRSKSGGLHLYLFFSEPTKANKVIDIMRDLLIILGLPKDTEVFPKQNKLTMGIGNWINLPYFGGDTTKAYLIKKDGTAASLREALNTISDRRHLILEIFEMIKLLPLSDALPCLQHLYMKKEISFRNEYLFSLATYFKAKHGDEFEFHLVRANDELSKPHTIDRLNSTIISSHKKKDYGYKCANDPLVSVCNKSACSKRKFGIGGDEVSELSYEEFTQFLTDPPHYEWKINDKKLKFFKEIDIIQQTKFRELCFRQLHILPYRLKDNTWIKIVNTALSNVVIVNVEEEDDISPGAMFKEYLTEFLENRAMASSKEQILLDRVFKDDECNQYIFKSKNLWTFLTTQKQFRYYGQVEVQNKLREMGGKPERYYISKDVRNARVWLLPYEALSKFKEKTLDDFEVDFLEDASNEY